MKVRELIEQLQELDGSLECECFDEFVDTEQAIYGSVKVVYLQGCGTVFIGNGLNTHKDIKESK